MVQCKSVLTLRVSLYYVVDTNFSSSVTLAFLQDDIVVTRPAKKHLEWYDRDLKSFRISKALDRVLEVSEKWLSLKF